VPEQRDSGWLGGGAWQLAETNTRCEKEGI
jgi:hypothetical protein